MLVENFMTYIQYLHFCGFVYTLCTDCSFTLLHECVCVCVCVCIHVRACVRARGRARIIFPVSWLNFHNNYEAYSESKYRFAVKKIE